MLNTKDFHLNIKFKIFSSTCDHLEFPFEFKEENIGKTLELQSQWSGEVSEWKVIGFRSRRNEAYSIELHPTEDTVKKYAKLNGYKMIVYKKGVK